MHDPASRGAPNAAAARLTADVSSGEEVKIRGAALLVRLAPGAAAGEAEWRELENAVHDELLEFFGQGLRPRPADLARLARELRAGRFRYAAAAAAGAGGGGGGGGATNGGGGDAELPGWGGGC